MTPVYDGEYPCADGKRFNPASIGTASRFSGGGSGHSVYRE
jgi:hypothetical protein